MCIFLPKSRIVVGSIGSIWVLYVISFNRDSDNLHRILQNHHYILNRLYHILQNSRNIFCNPFYQFLSESGFWGSYLCASASLMEFHRSAVYSRYIPTRNNAAKIEKQVLGAKVSTTVSFQYFFGIFSFVE